MRLIEDIISVGDILLEYIIDRGWKDYRRFARKLTERIIEQQPSDESDLLKLLRGLRHPFFALNEITRKQFADGFPLAEMLQQSRIPRCKPVPIEQPVPRRRRVAARRVRRRRRGISRRIRLMILERDGFRCCLCGKTARETKLEVDHKVPVAKGGTNSVTNLWTLCVDCNKGKSDLTMRLPE